MIYTNFGVKKLQRAARILEDKATDKSGSSLSVTPTSEEIEPLKEDVTKKSLTQVEEKKNDHDKDKDDSGKIWPIYKGQIFAACIKAKQIKTSISDCRTGLQKCLSGEKLESGSCFSKTSVTFKKKPKVHPEVPVETTSPVEQTPVAKEKAVSESDISEEPVKEIETNDAKKQTEEIKEVQKDANQASEVAEPEKKQEVIVPSEEDPKKTEQEPKKVEEEPKKPEEEAKKTWRAMPPMSANHYGID